MFGIGARSIISDRLSAAQAVRAQAALSQAVGGAQRPREGRHRRAEAARFTMGVPLYGDPF